ncbi:DUF4136 domain-containing protein [Pontibacter korlensis]|uniref:DUF4136 domain-containing protein n=1 Tax=Pontibacter korlensis TaxID=400092 RepID=A0A0E3ZGZ6_9BACT|nr:DUF4136 domain-containing protein [Pontibacter korlensis]AKD05229.1 hypothetical protein PKOR_21885 [Pontibacter korlensis]
MKTSLKLTVLSGIWCLFLAACSPVRVLESEADEGFRLSNYKTFNFFEVETSGEALQPYASQLDYLKQEIVQQLEQRGLQQSSSEPDLNINLGVVVAEKVQTRQTNILTDPPFYIGQRRYTWKSRDVEVGRYQQGTLSLHLVDNARNELVWQGAAEGAVPDDNAAKLQERIREGVQKLIQEIPQ